MDFEIKNISKRANNKKNRAIKIIIPFKTPTVNHLYGQRGFQKFLKPEAKKLRKEINNIIQPDTYGLSDLENSKLKVTVKIYENWLTRKGEIKKKDIANREKFLIDSVFESLGLDDKFIFEHKMIKIQSNKEKSIIKIEKL